MQKAAIRSMRRIMTFMKPRVLLMLLQSRSIGSDRSNRIL
jgi:hypothetical protein